LNSQEALDATLRDMGADKEDGSISLENVQSWARDKAPDPFRAQMVLYRLRVNVRHDVRVLLGDHCREIDQVSGEPYINYTFEVVWRDNKVGTFSERYSTARKLHEKMKEVGMLAGFSHEPAFPSARLFSDMASDTDSVAARGEELLAYFNRLFSEPSVLAHQKATELFGFDCTAIKKLAAERRRRRIEAATEQVYQRLHDGYIGAKVMLMELWSEVQTMQAQLRTVQGVFGAMAARSAMADAERRLAEEQLSEHLEGPHAAVTAELRQVDESLSRLLQQNSQLQESNLESAATIRKHTVDMAAADTRIATLALVAAQAESKWQARVSELEIVVAREAETALRERKSRQEAAAEFDASNSYLLKQIEELEKKVAAARKPKNGRATSRATQTDNVDGQPFTANTIELLPIKLQTPACEGEKLGAEGKATPPVECADDAKQSSSSSSSESSSDSSIEDEGLGTVPPLASLFVCVKSAAIYDARSMSCDPAAVVGELDYGREIVALEEKPDTNGVDRVLFEEGWVCTQSKKQSTILVWVKHVPRPVAANPTVDHGFDEPRTEEALAVADPDAEALAVMLAAQHILLAPLHRTTVKTILRQECDMESTMLTKLPRGTLIRCVERETISLPDGKQTVRVKSAVHQGWVSETSLDGKKTILESVRTV
jgi:hypothetical protein